MAVDETLSARMRAALAGQAGISEITMMGGRCFLLNGNMMSSARRDKDGTGLFMFRVGRDAMESALADPRAFPAVMGAREMKGYVRMKADECDEASLRDWLSRCVSFAATLPGKAVRP